MSTSLCKALIKRTIKYQACEDRLMLFLIVAGPVVKYTNHNALP